MMLQSTGYQTPVVREWLLKNPIEVSSLKCVLEKLFTVQNNFNPDVTPYINTYIPASRESAGKALPLYIRHRSIAMLLSLVVDASAKPISLVLNNQPAPPVPPPTPRNHLLMVVNIEKLCPVHLLCMHGGR